MRKAFMFSLLTIIIFGLVSCNKENLTEPTEPTETVKEEETMDLSHLPYFEYLNDNNPVVIIKVKEYGEMKLQLFPEVAPNTVNNFLKYIEEEAYNNSGFHRIIKDFMIQGGIVKNTKNPIKGDFTSNGVTNPLKHYKGVISMARTNVANSATSQFFIVHKTSPHLDNNYASFGGLIDGFDVLDLIANAKTDYYDQPTTKVVIESITVILNGYEPNEVIYI